MQRVTPPCALPWCNTVALFLSKVCCVGLRHQISAPCLGNTMGTRCEHDVNTMWQGLTTSPCKATLLVPVVLQRDGLLFCPFHRVQAADARVSRSSTVATALLPLRCGVRLRVAFPHLAQDMKASVHVVGGEWLMSHCLCLIKTAQRLGLDLS